MKKVIFLGSKKVRFEYENISEFTIDGITVMALNRKSAIKKINKLKS